MVLTKNNAGLGLALLAVIVALSASTKPISAVKTDKVITPEQLGWKESILKSFNNLLDLEQNKIIPLNNEVVQQLPNTLEPQHRQIIIDGCAKTEQALVNHIKDAIELLQKNDLKFSVERRLNAAQRLSKGCMFKLETYKVPVPPQLEALDLEFGNALRAAWEVANQKPVAAKKN